MPTLLLAFANSETNRLKTLSDEYIGVSNALQKREIEGDFKVVPLPIATREQILNEIRPREKDISLFLFSGHAGRDKLLLEDGAGHVEGIAALLGRCAKHKLKVVILNGCSTAGQVDLLLRQNVPIVIATSSPINDEKATRFSITFFKELAQHKRPVSEAFERAIEAAQLYGQIPQVDRDFRYLNFSRKDTFNTSVWGIYYLPHNKIEAYTWQLPIKEETKDIVIDLAFTLGRKRHSRRFNELFYLNDSSNSHSCQHCLIIGTVSQSPLGLSRKLTYEQIISQYSAEKYHYSCNPNFSKTLTNYIELGISHAKTTNLINAILNKFPGPWSDDTEDNDKRLAKFLSGYPHKKFVIIMLKIEYEDLTPVVIKNIGNFIKQLDQIAYQNLSSTRFLFFWNVLTPNSILPLFLRKPLIKSFIGLFRTNQIKNIFNSGAPIPIAIQSVKTGMNLVNEPFHELDTPSYDHINNWLNEYILPHIPINKQRKKQICQITDVNELENELIQLLKEAKQAIANSIP